MPEFCVGSLNGNVLGNRTGVFVPRSAISNPFRNGGVVGILEDIAVIHGHGLYGFSVCHKGYRALHHSVGLCSDGFFCPQAVQVVGVGDGSLCISLGACGLLRESKAVGLVPINFIVLHSYRHFCLIFGR